MISEIAVGTLMVLGTAFCFLAAFGLVRMPDIFSRLQASTKATTLGAGLVMVAVAVFFRHEAAITRALAVMLFLFVTAPVSGHMLSRAAYLLGVKLWTKDNKDDLAEYLKEQGIKKASDPDRIR